MIVPTSHAVRVFDVPSSVAQGQRNSSQSSEVEKTLQGNDAAQPVIADVVEFSDDFQSLTAGSVVDVQFNVNKHAGIMDASGQGASPVAVNESYSEARMYSMPKLPTVEEVRAVIMRKMARATDAAYLGGNQQSGAIQHAAVVAQMGIATPQAPLDVHTMQSVQSATSVQVGPRVSGYSGYKPMSSRAVSSAAQSNLRVRA
ncbi:hypothetical protein [Halodesulfovibrio spirochaetisodalis]|uniref:Uncharacterized protein n=1 Tax=Halodesulfovibrio spirochaetisodalis TaxID=1560234 RepID=A0A1B7X9S7_9BACT|nr:hypothetical protein [Halodesulfovibrio spirochaetisodalis]OBQ46108.1 hypothetical protein SP90_14575 [Halodesulfovibrio spirochaetisodalis]